MTENNEDIIVTTLRRRDRCFLNIENNPSKSRYLRGHLKYRCKIIIGEKVDEQQIKMYEGKDEYLCQDFPHDCKDALNDMLKTDGNNKQRKALAHMTIVCIYTMSQHFVNCMSYVQAGAPKNKVVKVDENNYFDS